MQQPEKPRQQPRHAMASASVPLSARPPPRIPRGAL
jgi:hypothetical protein